MKSIVNGGGVDIKWNGPDTDNNEEEARWTAHLSDVHVPPFVAASGPNIALDNPSE